MFRGEQMLIRSLRYHAASTILKGLALAALAGGAADAAGVDQQAMFNAYVASPAYRAILEKAYNTAEPAASKATCPVLKLTAFDQREMVVPVQFVKSGTGWQTADGAWVQRASLDRCGQTVLRRVMVETAANNTLRTRGLLPGEYAGGYKFEDKARGTVVNDMLALTHCTDWRTPAVLDTSLKGTFKPGAPWTEYWTVLVCGKTVKARVDYAPGGGNDMNIVASLAPAH